MRNVLIGLCLLKCVSNYVFHFGFLNLAIYFQNEIYNNRSLCRELQITNDNDMTQVNELCVEVKVIKPSQHRI